MITEDYCNLDIAKLLKEKGFDWSESPFYSEQDRDEWRQNNSYTIPNMEYNPELPFDSEELTMVAPHVSIQMAMKWLREVHNYAISICLDTYVEPYDNQYYIVIRRRKDKYEEISPCEQVYFDTYEEAAEAGIKYCLENLI